MISFKDFEGTSIYKVASFSECLSTAKALRARDEAKATIEIEGKEEEGVFEFPYDGFHLRFQKGSIIYASLYAKMKDKDGKELTTWKTPTLKVTGSHNIFEGANIENRALSPETKGQEVALGVYGDDNLFIGCRLKSTQDTLFVGPLPDDLITRYNGFLPNKERYVEGNERNYFAGCHIIGSVDYVFGAGQAVFFKCSFSSIKDGRKNGATYVAAPSHSLKDPFGFLFYDCHFIDGGANKSNAYLARPWRDYGKAVFAYCHYDSHITKEGFSDWSDVIRVKTARFEEYPLKEGRIAWINNKKGSVLPKQYESSVSELEKALL